MPALNITVTGNLAHDPELRYTPTEVPVASFTVANNERFRDQAGEWKDGATSFVRCHVWREQAEHVAECLQSGDRVVVVGILRARTYEDKEGSKRTSWEVTVSEVAASVRYATVKIKKTSRDRSPVPEDPFAGDPAQSAASAQSDPAAGPVESKPPF